MLGDVGQGAELLLHQLTLVSTVGAELPHPPDDLTDDLHHLSLPQVANVGAFQGDGAYQNSRRHSTRVKYAAVTPTIFPEPLSIVNRI